MEAFPAPKLTSYSLPPVANKQPTIRAKKTATKLNLTEGSIFGSIISLSPTCNFGIIFLTKRALISGICLVVVGFTSINTLLITASLLNFPQLDEAYHCTSSGHYQPLILLPRSCAGVEAVEAWSLGGGGGRAGMGADRPHTEVFDSRESSPVNVSVMRKASFFLLFLTQFSQKHHCITAMIYRIHPQTLLTEIKEKPVSSMWGSVEARVYISFFVYNQTSKQLECQFPDQDFSVILLFLCIKPIFQ